MYSIWAEDFAMLPEKIKYDISHYLVMHGVDITACRGLTIVPESPGIWVEYYGLDENGAIRVWVDEEGNSHPDTYSEWISLPEWRGHHIATFLEWMTPGENPPAHLGEAGKNTRQPKVHLSDKEWGGSSGWSN